MADNWWEQDIVKDEETEQESQNWWEQDIIENEPTVALPESNVIIEEVVVNPELQTYAQELQDIQGGYEEADLEAAGFSTEDIKSFNESISNDQNTSGEASGDGGGIYMGVPSTDMYEGYKVGNIDDNFKDRDPESDVTAFEVYNAYADSLNTVIDPFGNLFYTDPVSNKTFKVPYPERDGTMIPFVETSFNEVFRRLAPDYYANLDADVNEGTRLLNEINDGMTNTVEAVAAITDVTAKKLLDKDTTFLEWANTIPKTSSGGSTVDALTGEGAALATSFFSGKILMDGAIKGGSKILSRFMTPLVKTENWRKLGQPVIDQIAAPVTQMLRYAGPELGIAFGAETDMVTLISPFDVDPNSTDAEQVLAARMNIFVDSLLISGILETAAKSGLKLIDFVNGASVGAVAKSLLQSDSAKMISAMDNVLTDLAQVQASSTRQSVDESRKRLIEIIKNNQKLLIEEVAAGKPKNDLVLDVFSALEAGRDITPETLSRIQQIRSGIVTDPKNRGKLLAANNKVATKTQEILADAADSALPANATMDDAVEGIVKSNENRLVAQQKRIFEAQENIKTADEEAINSILSDPTLSPVLSRLTKVSPSEVSALSVEKKREIARTLIDEAERMTKKKNDFFDAIPEGAAFDYDSFGALIETLSKETDQFGTEGAEFLNKRLIATIKAAYTKNVEEVAPSGLLDASGNPIASTQTSTTDLATELFESGVDFKRLYNDIRPAISDLAEEAFNNGRGPVGKKLREVVKFIDEQVEFVANNNPAAKDTAQAAMKYYKNEFIPLWGDSPLDQFYKTFSETRQRNINPVKEVAQSQAQFVNTLEGGAGEEVGQLVKVLEVSDEGVNSEAVQEYITARIFEDLYDDIARNGLTNLDADQLSAGIKQYSDQIRGNFDPLAMELDQLQARIIAAKDNGLEVSDVLKQAQEQFDIMKRDSFSKMIEGLVNKNVPGSASSNVENKILTIMNSKDGADNIAKILEETNNNPIVVGGLKKLYLEELNRKAFSISAETTTGGPVASVAKIRNILAENSDLAATGNVILNNDPDLADILKTLLTTSANRAARLNSKALPASSGTPEIQQYQNAINTMVNVIVGPLNRIGTQARTGARLAAEKLDIANRYAIVMDAVVADSELAVKVIKILEKRYGTKGIGPIRLPKDLYDEMFTIGIRIGRYAQSDKEEVFNTWDETLIETVEQVDNLRDNASSTLDNAISQSKELFNKSFPAITQ
tara:strand:- start:366 stop:4058 length:3693 start_codon:yes stop_codon:yes gene_type:complete